MTQTIEQLQARVRELEEEKKELQALLDFDNARLDQIEDELEDVEYLGPFVEGIKVLKTQLAAAQEEWNQCSGLLDDAHRSIEMLEDQLAKAEQRVSEACDHTAWISVIDALPKPVKGVSYNKWMSDVVLVIHSDRPDYPVTAHAILGDELGAGISILTNGASDHKEIAWYSAGVDLQNPFNLKDKDYSRYLPRIFGAKITHWMPLPKAPANTASS